jgi:C-terminal processing protease CtpA/Prc
MKKFLYGLCAAVVFCLPGCIRDDVNSFNDKNLSDDERINKFIIDGVQTYYLWEAENDWEKYNGREAYAKYDDHDKLFNELRYIDDQWSYLTDDIEGLENKFAGITTTFGYTLSLYRLQSDDIIGVVLYTTPNSPAANAGLKRGDIIIEMNGGKITMNNYLDLYYASSLQLRCGELDRTTGVISALPEVRNITAVNMYENPINTYKIIEKSGHKIGYLCYTGYQMQSEAELIRIFKDFKSAGVREVALDLRYNPGGYSRTSLLLSSILAPESAIKHKSIFLEHHYNALYTAFLVENKYALNELFVDTLSVNMNLSRLYVLTGSRTASASEATMVGLKPYLQVVQVGNTTSGKYCGGVLLAPEDIFNRESNDYYANFSNWGMYIMIYRFANIYGINSFTGGLVPDIRVDEDEFDLKPFGDENDPLLGSALAHLTGEPYIAPRSKVIPPPFIPLPDIKRPVDGRMVDKLRTERLFTK